MRDGVLSGQWIGRYVDVDGRPVSFDAMLRHEGAALLGTVREPTAAGGLAEARSVIVGSVAGDTVRFHLLLAEADAPVPDCVGCVIDGGRRVAGTWRRHGSRDARRPFSLMRCVIAAPRLRILQGAV